MITVTINNQPTVMPDDISLAEALTRQGIKPQGIATAINGSVINQSARETTKLNDGDSILVIKAFCGG